MAQHLTDKDIENIVELLDYWPFRSEIDLGAAMSGH